MMFAAIGASHANLAALDAVLDAIDEEGIVTVVTTGGHAVGGADTTETVARVQSRKLPAVHAPDDRLAARFQRKKRQLERELESEKFARIHAAYAALSSSQVEWLLALPKEKRLAVDAVEIAVIAAAESASDQGIAIEEDTDRLRRLRERANAEIVVLGGSQFFAVESDGALIVCPGDIRDPSNPGVARYAVISTEDDPWHAEIRTVPLSSVRQDIR